MKITDTIGRLDKFNVKISIWFERVAIIAVLGMILGTLIDVIGAKVFNAPLRAGTELIYLLQVIAIGGALAISKIDGRHVRIELIDRLPQPALGIIHSLVALLGIVLFALLTWGSFEYMQSLRINNDVTSNVRFPLFPFALWQGLCCIPVILILISEFVGSLREIKRK